MPSTQIQVQNRNLKVCLKRIRTSNSENDSNDSQCMTDDRHVMLKLLSVEMVGYRINEPENPLKSLKQSIPTL